MPRKRAEQIAQDACLQATVIELRRDAEELAAVVRQTPVPVLPGGPLTERELLLVAALQAAEHRAARLLEMLACKFPGETIE
jgi:hypothetical protein